MGHGVFRLGLLVLVVVLWATLPSRFIGSPMTSAFGWSPIALTLVGALSLVPPLAYRKDVRES
jgi:hypothetical protein